MAVVASLVCFAVACVMAACILSDALLQRVATVVRGAPLEPRRLLTVRKVGYVVLVVYLFSNAFAWRHYVLNVQAGELAVREQSRGDVHLTGSLMRLGLGGFRGVTTCYLWNVAMEKQMKNQLNELEVVVGWLTDLQPHFNTPWVFQSWNLAYNVSNKTDRISDKYFYITRGIRLLADGERQNHDDPDLRFELGTTYQHKICQSDETNYHRSLFQLSMIPPNERDPARFRPQPGTRQNVNLQEFVKFCEKHPQLVRRLREGIRKDSTAEQRRLFTCSTPQAVVQFLADNYRVPSLYPEERLTPPAAPWAENPNEKPDPDVLERFPILPPPRAYPAGSPLHVFRPYDDMTEGDLTDLSPYEQDLDSWDAYLIARSWYSYSQEPIPDPAALPGETEPVTDRIHQRVPRHMMTVIFRHYPARAQSYVAERLEEEGWFDREGWSTKGPEWFTDVIGGGRDWATDAWRDAARMWQAHGERNHLLLPTQADEDKLRALDKAYTDGGGLTPAKGPQPAENADPITREGWRRRQFLANYDSSRSVSNFMHNYSRAAVEQDPKVVRARKLFFQAQTLAATGSTVEALRLYQDPEPDPDRLLGGQSALQAWAEILKDKDDFRHNDLVAEESYETQLDYLDVLNRAIPGNELKAQFGAAATAGASAAGWFTPAGLLEVRRPDLFPALTVTKGPFDQLDKDGRPWVNSNIVNQVQERRRQFQPRKKDVDEAPPPARQTPPPPPGPGA